MSLFLSSFFGTSSTFRVAVKKILVVVALCLGLAFCLLLFLLPVLLSSDFVLHKVLARVNSRPGISLDIKDVNIGWRQGLDCVAIVYVDTVRGLRLNVDELQGDRGLLALLAAPKKFGTIRVRKPVLNLTQNGNNSTGKPSAKKSSTRPAPSSVSSRKSDALDGSGQSAPLWQDLAVRLIVEDGRVRIHNKDGKTGIPEGKIALTSALADGTINYTLQWQGGDQGRLSAEGYVNLPAHRQNFLDTLVARMHLTVKQFQLAPLLALAGRTGKVPTGKGIVDGEITVTGAGPDKVDMLGNLNCTDLELSGGVLGKDHPRIDKITLHIDGGKKDRNNWLVNTFTVDGDPGRMEGSGSYAAENGSGRIKGLLQLPFFFNQLPHLFKLQKEASVTGGELRFDAGLSKEKQDQRLHLDASVKHLTGLLHRRPFSWGNAATVSLVTSGSPVAPVVDQLKVTTSFAHLQGKGSLADFSIDGTLDLAKANRQVGRLFSLPWSGVGRLSLQAGSQRVKNNRYQVTFKVKSPKLSLLRQGKTILPASPVTVNVRALLPVEWLGNTGKGKADIVVDGSLWPGTFSLSANGLTRMSTGISSGYDLSADLHLERLAGLLHNLKILPQTTGFAGRLRATAGGYLTDKVISLGQLDAAAKELVVISGKTVFKEDNLVLQSGKSTAKGKAPIIVHKLQVASSLGNWGKQGGVGATFFDRKNQSVMIRDMRLRSGLADLDIHNLHIDNIRQPLKLWKADLGGRIDLARLKALVPVRAGALQQVKISGQSTFVLKADQQQKPYPLSFDWTTPRFRLVNGGKVVFSDQELSMLFRASGLLAANDLTIRKLQLNTPPLDIQGRGSVHRVQKPKVFLEGRQTVDFAAIGKLIKIYTGLDLAMRGRKAQDFSLAMMPGPESIKTGRFTSSLWLEKLKYSGIEAGPLTVPVALADGALRVAAAGTLNGGRLNIDTTCNLVAEPAGISMPPALKILSDVQIDRPLADGVLAKIHPLFGILARPSGSVSGTMENFYWPLAPGAGDQARFKVVFDVGKVTLDSRGILQEVLGLLGVGDQSLTLKESEITCTGENGRIGCTPVRVLVADSQMTISGSVGLDQTLDYLLEIPVTPKLIGREGARVLAGTTIKVPIRGTLKKPDFNRNMITDTLADLAGQAAKKAIKDQVKKLVPGLFKGLKF